MIENTRILIVDDNQAIHDDFRKILCTPEQNSSMDAARDALFGDSQADSVTFKAYQLDSAFQGQEALAKVTQALRANEPYALAFVDVRMPPGWDGIETIRRLWQVDPDLQVVVCTAYSDYGWEQMVNVLGQSDRVLILKKPFDQIEVCQLASALTQKWVLARQAALKMSELEALVAARTQQLDAEHQRAISFRTELLQYQKMEALGSLAGGIAHDVNNLLTVILGYGDAAQEELPPDSPAIESLQAILDAGWRAADLIARLLVFSRKPNTESGADDVNTVIAQLEPMLRRLIRRDIELDIRLSPGEQVVAVPASYIEQVVINLAVNAGDAMPGGGKLTIETTSLQPADSQHGPQTNSTNGYVRLRVADTGCGMDEETQKHIFEPFYTTKPVGEGTGLGLSTVYGIVHRFEGRITVDSQPGRGTRFDIVFPLCEQQAATTEPNSNTESASGSETILLVDDEEAIRKLATRALQQAGYSIHQAQNGREAQEKFLEDPSRYDLIVTDVIMPKMNGAEFVRWAKKTRADLRVLYMSGHSGNLIDDTELAEHDFLQKPFTAKQLLAAVRASLDRNSNAANSPDLPLAPLTLPATAPEMLPLTRLQ